jgi:hypothetical protein
VLHQLGIGWVVALGMLLWLSALWTTDSLGGSWDCTGMLYVAPMILAALRISTIFYVSPPWYEYVDDQKSGLTEIHCQKRF